MIGKKGRFEKNKIEFQLDGFLSKKTETEVKRLYISFIFILEKLLDEGKISDEEFSMLRKEVLDGGNNSIRNMQEQIGLIFSNLKLNGEFLIDNS